VIDTSPASDDAASPLLIDTEPVGPLVLAPDDTLIEPDEPDAASPVLTLVLPLPNVLEPIALEIVTLPLSAPIAIPLNTLTEPPTEDPPLAPPASDNDPLCATVLAPTAIFTVPL
jgi:hypothetical protein